MRQPSRRETGQFAGYLREQRTCEKVSGTPASPCPRVRRGRAGGRFLMARSRTSLAVSSWSRRVAAAVPALLMTIIGTPQAGAAGQPYTALTAMGSPASSTAWNGQSNGQWDVISEDRATDAAATA